MVTIASVKDFRQAARRRLPPFLFHYIDGASYEEMTCRRNVEDLQAIALQQKVLTNVSSVDLRVDILGREQALPVMLGPIGLSGMYARRGEVQAASAASAKGVPFCLSTVSVCALAEVASATPGPLWFQLYVIRDRAFMIDLLDQARAAGCQTLIFTVDMPMPGARHRDQHSGMSGQNAALRRVLQGMTHPAWAWDVGIRGKPHTLGNIAPVLGGSSGMEDFIGWMAKNFDPSVTWKDLEFIRDNWKGNLIIKGIMSASDALEAQTLGADGVVVSNHGGRQLDGVPSTVRALPAIAAALGDRTTVLVDGGVRSGLDVVRMLALGAKGVLLGRAWAYALGAQGGAGVTKLLNIIEAEMRIAMALTGSTHARSLDRSILADC